MSVKLSDIKIDGGTQMRATINQDTVAEYRELIASGFEFGPIDVFYDGSNYWLADGFHRVIAANELKKLRIKATIHKGSQRDAILFACGANSQHGLRRTNADKRRAVETLLADTEWGKWSSRKLAEAAGVSHVFVETIRGALVTVSNTTKRQGSDGRDFNAKKPPTSRPTWEESIKTGEPIAIVDNRIKQAAESIADDNPTPKADKKDLGETIRLERSKFKKTMEAMMRLIDDLQKLRKSGQYELTLSFLREAIRAIDKW